MQENQNYNNEIEQEDNEEDDYENISNIGIPHYFSLFENINIFNSILIMMNNISYINQYFKEERTQKVIDNCNKDNQYCLVSIMYNISKYLWNTKNSLIKENELLNKYSDFLDCYIKTNCKNQNPSNYCYNIMNLSFIIDFIYSKINKELTREKLKKIANNNNYYGNDPLSIYINNFSQTNKSILSDYFMGFYENQKICGNCQSRNQRFGIYNNNNFIQFSYSSFSNIVFDMNSIKIPNIRNNYNNMNNMNNMYMNNLENNNYNNINIYNCFDYVFGQQNKRYQSYCNNCYISTIHYEFNNIYMLPKILSIILSNNQNFNFVLNDELDLKKYSKNYEGDGVYSIVSILCQKIYNKKYICYCINPNNGSWYSYSDGKINQVEKMDINAIPLIVIYQLKNTIKFNYKNIIREDNNKICLNIKCSIIPPLKLVVNKNMLIKDIIEKIHLYANIENNINIKFLINATKAKNEQALSDLIGNKNEKEIIVGLITE